MDAARATQQQRRVEQRDGHLETVRARRPCRAPSAARTGPAASGSTTSTQDGGEHGEERQEPEEAAHPPILGASDDQCRNRPDEGHHAPRGAKLGRARSRVPAGARPAIQVEESVRHLSRRTKVPGLPAGQGAARHARARARHPARRSRRREPDLRRRQGAPLRALGAARRVQEDDLDVLSIPEPEWLSFERGRRRLVPGHAAGSARGQARRLHRLSVRHHRSTRSTMPSVDKVIEQLRDQQASLVPVEDRGAATDDYAVIRSPARATAQPVEGATAERMPLIIGRERFVPGFEDQLDRPARGRRRRPSRSPSPTTIRRPTWPASRSTSRSRMLELREKRLPEADDDFARSLGDVRRPGRAARRDQRAAGAQRARPRAARLRRPDHRVRRRQRHARAARPADRARAGGDGRRAARSAWPSRASATTTTCAPPSATRRRSSRSSGPTPSGASRRCSCCREIAEKEGVEVTDEELDADLARSRERYAGNPRWSPTSNRRAAGPTRARCCGARRRSRRWSIAGSSNIPSSRTCNICTTTITTVTITRPRRTTRHITRKEVADARPDGHRELEPGRARLRHLQPAAEGPDHLPGRPDRRPHGQPDHRPAALPRGRGSRARHLALHQLAGRRGHGRPGHLRHDAVPARAGVARSASAWPRRMAAVLLAAGAKGKRYALPNSPDHDPPGLGRLPRQHARRASSRSRSSSR